MRVVAVSDTHKYYTDLKLPKGDVFIHCGDFDCEQNLSEVHHFNRWLKKIDFAHKIIVPGNHDFLFQEAHAVVLSIIEESNTICLINHMVEINGKKFFGSPYTPRFGGWAFMKDRGEPMKRIWDSIPEGLDVLITHGPPHKILDKVAISQYNKLGYKNEGCADLRKRVFEVKPKYHVFGHLHDNYGLHEEEGIKFINASVLDENYDLVKEPVVFDI